VVAVAVTLLTDEGSRSFGTAIDAVIGVVFGVVAAAPLVAAFALCGAAWVQDSRWRNLAPPALALGIFLVVVVAEGLAGEGIVWWLIPVGIVVVALAFFGPWAWQKIRHEDVRQSPTATSE
jgi:hypothetical protein